MLAGISKLSTQNDGDIRRRIFGDIWYRLRRCTLKATKTLKKQTVTLLLITEFAGCVVLYGNLGDARNRIQSLTSQIGEITLQNSELKNEKELLLEKVSILSETINMKVQREKEQEEEIRQSYIPTRLPFQGTASYNGQEKELDGNPIAKFYNANGISIVATANGTVASVEGNRWTGVTVTVDHGNGYISIYKSNVESKVSEGERVTNETVLFQISAQNKELGYQIIENGAYIEPIELIESYG